MKNVFLKQSDWIQSQKPNSQIHPHYYSHGNQYNRRQKCNWTGKEIIEEKQWEIPNYYFSSPFKLFELDELLETRKRNTIYDNKNDYQAINKNTERNNTIKNPIKEMQQTIRIVNNIELANKIINIYDGLEFSEP